MMHIEEAVTKKEISLLNTVPVPPNEFADHTCRIRPISSQEGAGNCYAF